MFAWERSRDEIDKHLIALILPLPFPFYLDRRLSPNKTLTTIKAENITCDKCFPCCSTTKFLVYDHERVLKPYNAMRSCWLLSSYIHDRYITILRVSYHKHILLYFMPNSNGKNFSFVITFLPFTNMR